jgi:hypothetical protein
MTTEHEISTVAQFINPRQAMIDAGELTSFHEVELADLTEVFGNVAHRFSAYEKRGTVMSWPAGSPAGAGPGVPAVTARCAG